MAFWKDVWSLVRFELRHSWKYYGLSLILVVFLILLVRSMIPDYMESASMGLDFFFVLSFVLFSQFSRPKQFQLQKISGIHYTAPFLITLNQLAIDKRKIVAYKFIVYFITSNVFGILLLLGLYPFFSPYIPLFGYIVFSVVWLAAGMYIGGVNPAFEAYSNLGWNIFYACFIGLGIFVFYIYAFYHWYHSGLVAWTMNMAIDYPLLSLTVSVILAVIGIIFWMKVMKRKMKKTDYMA